MKKILKIIIILVVVGGVAFGAYTLYNKFMAKNRASVESDMSKFDENLAVEVSVGDMISSLSFVGNTKIRNQQKLKFNYESRITGVFKKAGDRVKEKELIAELDKSAIYSQVEILKLGVQNAELKLKKILENNSNIEVNKAKNSVEKLKEDLKNQKQNLVYFEEEQKTKMADMEKALRQKETEYRILQAETKVSISNINSSPAQKEQELQKLKNSLNTSQLEYERDKTNFDLNFSKKENEYYSRIEKEYMNIDSLLNSLNKTFKSLDELLRTNINDKTYDNNYYIYYSAKDSKYKSESSTYFQRAYSSYKKLDDEMNKLSDRRNIEKLLDLLDVETKMYSDLAVAGTAIMKGLDNSIETADFSESVISGFYSQAQSMYSDANSKIVELKSLPLELKTLKKPEDLKRDMENELQTKKDQIEDLKISIKKMEDDTGLVGTTNKDKIEQEAEKLINKKQEIDNYKLEIEKTKTNSTYELDSKKRAISDAEIQITEAEKNLKNLLDESSNQELILAQNDLKQANISLENEIKKLETYEITAPFDGIITKIDYQVGDNLTQNDDKYIMLENPDMLEINIFVDQVDIVNLSKGQKAKVTYDAFPGTEFDVEIYEIDSTPQDKDGVTKYEVKIFLEKPEKAIFSGMNANVVIITQELLGVLTAPFTAVNVDPESGEEFVVVLTNSGKKEKRVVQTGYTDGVNTEIVEGLQEGEKVLSIAYDANYFKVDDFNNQDGGGRMYF